MNEEGINLDEGFFNTKNLDESIIEEPDTNKEKKNDEENKKENNTDMPDVTIPNFEVGSGMSSIEDNQEDKQYAFNRPNKDLFEPNEDFDSNKLVENEADDYEDDLKTPTESFKEIDELENEDNQKDDYSEIDDLKSHLQKLEDEANKEPKFAKTESKFDFASEVINSLNSQKVSNLDDTEIDDLIDKRKFTNLCRHFEWNILNDIMGNVVKDIESYSLSKNALLVKLITTDLSKNFAVTEQQVKKTKGGRKNRNENEEFI